MAASSANKNDVDVVFDTTEEEIFTAIDKKAIDRIMLNLLSNAVKSINGKGSIIVRCSRNKDTVFIIVKDNKEKDKKNDRKRKTNR